MDPRRTTGITAQPRESANGKAASEADKPKAPTAMAAIDLAVDLSALKYDRANDEGAESLLMYRHRLETALESFEAMSDKLTAVNREIGARLHKVKTSKVRIHEGKNMPLDGKIGEVFRVRQVNGSDPPVYLLYSERPRKAKDGAAKADLTDL